MTRLATRYQHAWRTARTRAHADDGSMPLAMFVVLALILLSLTIASALAWQVAQNRTETAARTATWAVESTLNTAAEALGSSGHQLNGMPLTIPDEWTTGVDGTSATRWWAIPLSDPRAVTATPPATITAAASSEVAILAVTANNRTYRSADGRSWTRLGGSPIPAADIAAISYGLNRWIIVAKPDSSAASTVYTSKDGASWTAADGDPTPAASSTETTAGIACSADRCTLITTTPGTATRYWTSTNSTDWTLTGSSNDGLAVADTVIYASNRFLAAGATSAGVSRSSFSTDGLTWSSATTISADPDWTVDDLAHVQGAFIAVAHGTHKTIATSPDGLAWTARTLPVTRTWTDLHGNGRTAMLIASGTATYLTSDDAVAWTTRSLPDTGTWNTATPLGSSWLITATTRAGYLVSSTVGQPAITDKVLLVAEAKAAGQSTAGVTQNVLAYDWDPSRQAWSLTAAYASLTLAMDAAFTVDPVSAAQPLTDGTATFTFTDTSTGNPDTWMWDFGDGTTSTEQNPTHSYSEPGQFTVTLQVSVTGGYTSTTQQQVTVQTLPGPVRHITGTPGLNAVSLSWLPPLDDGNSSVLNYDIAYRVTGTTDWTTVTRSPSAATTQVLLGEIAGGGDHDVRVRAVTSVGYGPWSAPVTVRPLSAPTAPTDVTIAGTLDLTVTWTQPASTGGAPISEYTVEYATTPAFANPSTLTTGNTYAQITGLTSGTTYYVRVSATNLAGPSPTSPTVTVTTEGGPPNPPTNVTATVIGGYISVTFTPPSVPGNPPLSYILEYDTDPNFTNPGAVGPATDTDIPFTPAPDTWYYVRVTTFANATGGQPSAPVTVRSATVPEPLPNLSATGTDGAVLLSWTPPTLEQSGRTPLLHHQISWSSPNGTVNSFSVDAGVSSILIDVEDTTGDGNADGPLTNDHPYTFTVTTFNAVGPRTEFILGTPMYGPTQPTDLALTRGGTNLVKNPSFETGITNWNGSGISNLLSDTSQSHVGLRSLRVTWNGTPNATLTPRDSGAPIGGIIAGQTYQWSVYVRNDTATVDFTPKITWYTSGAQPILVSVGSSAAVTSTGWTRISMQATAPANAAYALAALSPTTTPGAGHRTFVDAASFTQSTRLQAYFDGNAGSGFAWAGTANNSYSTATSAKLFLTWTQPASLLPITGYEVQVASDAAFTTDLTTTTVTGSGPNAIVTAATGTAWHVRVRAVSNSTPSAWSAPAQASVN